MSDFKPIPISENPEIWGSFLSEILLCKTCRIMGGGINEQSNANRKRPVS